MSLWKALFVGVGWHLTSARPSHLNRTCNLRHKFCLQWPLINLDSRVIANIAQCFVTLDGGNEGRSYPHGSTVRRTMVHTEVSRNLSIRGTLPLSLINWGDKILSILKILCYSLMAPILTAARCSTSYQKSGVYCVKLVSPMLFVTVMGCVKISIKLHTNIRKILLEEKAHTVFLNADDILLYWQIQNAPYNPRWQKHNTQWENLQESPKTRQKVYFFLDSAALRYLRTGNIKW